MPGKNYQTREVRVGSLAIGGNNPVRIQSMTTSDTRDVKATVDQIVRLADAGCELVRITVQGQKEAEACEAIKEALARQGLGIPLAADIHFYPPAALRVVEFVDKVRINPGNFADKRASFKTLIYDDASYETALNKVEEKFAPLVLKCKKLGRAMRIGTNHGSLSDRVMNRFGDSPEGMVESAFEYARICRKYDYHDLIFSMKSSNPKVMVAAYRLLVEKMQEMGWDYPLHLGVTEAGAGKEGRIKSAMGIGSLLLDGLGDTIRFSLTEDPWEEIAPARELASWAENRAGRVGAFVSPLRIPPEIPAPLHRDGSVVLRVKPEQVEKEDFFQQVGCEMQLGRPVKGELAADAIVADFKHPKLETLAKLGIPTLDRFLLSVSKTPHLAARTYFEEQRPQDPVILDFPYEGPMQAAASYGSLLCDGLGEGIVLPLEAGLETGFMILQAARMRASTTEFISCPGCGRTLFDLQEVAGRIRDQTGHLPGVKIAIMGCIVNGPGEMADADFGYVGSLPGKIDLYVGKERVEKHIPMEVADERLIELIKAHGRWIDK